MNDTLEIFLEDVRVPLRVGYYTSERAAPQSIIVSLTLTLNAAPDYTKIGEDLSQLLDYSTLHDYLTQQLPQLPHQPFLETMAEHILQFCWRDPRVQRTRIRIQKPEIFPDTPNIGIVLERQRPV